MPIASTELVRTRVELDPLAFSSANVHRTPGVHLTDVLKDMEIIASGGKTQPGTFTRADLDRFALQGYLWEDAMTETLRGRVRGSNGAAIGAADYMRLPEIAMRLDASDAWFIDSTLPADMLAELTRGCVLLTPDGMRLEPQRLLECKWTTKSANMNPQTDKRIWFSQVRGYLLALSVALRAQILDVEWHVQFPCGTRWGDPPIYERWDKHYEPAELMQQWTAIQQHVAWRVANDDVHGWGRYL